MYRYYSAFPPAAEEGVTQPMVSLFILAQISFQRGIKSSRLSLVQVVNLNITLWLILHQNSFGSLICCVTCLLCLLDVLLYIQIMVMQYFKVKIMYLIDIDYHFVPKPVPSRRL